MRSRAAVMRRFLHKPNVLMVEQRRPQVRECGIVTNYSMFKSLPVVHRIAASTIFRTRNTSSISRGAYTIIYPRHLISDDSPSTDHASIGQN